MRIASLVSAMATLLASGSYGQDLSNILREVDDANKVGAHFAFEMQVESFEGDKSKEANQIVGFSTYDNSLDIKTIIHFVAPKSVVGRKMLIEGSYIWASFPKTRNLIRLTPLQILLGEVAYGDVLRIVYNRDYDAESVSDTTVSGIAAKRIQMSLKPSRAGANYPRIDLVVDAANRRVLRSRIYGGGGRIMKTVEYSDPALFEGRMINRKIRIDDAIKPGRYSTMHYLRMGNVEVDAAHFSKDMLGRARIYDF